MVPPLFGQQRWACRGQWYAFVGDRVRRVAYRALALAIARAREVEVHVQLQLRSTARAGGHHCTVSVILSRS